MIDKKMILESSSNLREIVLEFLSSNPLICTIVIQPDMG